MVTKLVRMAFEAWIRLFIRGVGLLFLSTTALGNYQYELIEREGHKIHVVIIDPKGYEVSLVAAHNQVFGRERVGDIADRENAQIAINGGFFQIGDIEDGRPTGTLVSNGQIFGMRTTEHNCLVKRGDKFTIEMLKPKLKITLAGQVIEPKQFNKFARGKSVFYFNRAWGSTTLSNYNTRQEIIFDARLKVIDVAQHGNNEIPQDGYVLSFPKQYDLNSVKVGERAICEWSPDYLPEKNNFAIMGIPALILNGKIKEGLANEEVHARTAVGILADGKIALVVAEHVYKRSVADITIKEIQAIMSKKQLSSSDIKVSDIKKVILEELSGDNAAVGLTSLELANFMQEIGCVSAINLDGGGSSTLYIDGKYINEAIGDIDEAAGRAVVRPVSDAIVFRKKAR